MSERKWTKAQLEAINFSGKNLILSAAAGSGKTATMTERIIRLLKDADRGADLSRMLIVTFTVAAAGELKSRIADALNEAIAADGQNKGLIRQLSALEGAHISTMDSFFKSELRPYFSLFGLPPEFSMIDEAEAAVLKKEAMEETIAAFFDRKTATKPEDFCALADCLSTARNEGDLTEMLLKLSSSLRSFDLDKEALFQKADDLESNSSDFFMTEYSAPLKSHLTSFALHYKIRFEHMAEVLKDDPYTEKYVPEAKNLALICDELIAGKERSYGFLCAFCQTVVFDKLSPISRGKSTEDYENFKNFRNEFKKVFCGLRDSFFSQDTSTVSEVICATAGHIRTLACVDEYFNNRYAAAKRERGGVDFADLSAFARKLFVGKDNEPTKAAIETGKKFDYIFIDEYQDTNQVQDDIFSAISTSAGRFMVGDVKQSIYGFRDSKPELFTGYRRKYENGDGGSAIFMSENFRSDKNVIDFSNLVSQYIFSAGKTPFESSDHLVYSKTAKDSEAKCEILLTEKEDDDGEELFVTEPQAVANRITELLSSEKLSDDSPITPGDIAILLRSGTHAEEFALELTKRGIPTKNAANEDFFAYGEVLLVLCLLNTADNPMRDIYLAGAMKSPLFNFTLSDLVNIRQSTSVPLWYSLKEYCESGEDSALAEKCRSFKTTVERWREASRSLYCDEMLRLILSDTDFRSYGGDRERSPAQINRSLKTISDHAAGVAKRGGTLHDFITHLNSVMERRDKGGAVTDNDCVTIMTVHASKGLEFPVCFLCDASKRFNNQDSSDKMLIDKSGKIAMKLYDDDGIVRCDNILRRAVALQMKEDNAEEEARILYVALTRARERLIVSCRVKNASARLADGSAKAEFPLDSYEVFSQNTYADWIIDALQRYGCTGSYVYTKGHDGSAHYVPAHTIANNESKELLSFFEKSLDFSYEKEYLCNIPAKLSVSVLKPDLLGSDEEKSFIDEPRITSMPEAAPVPPFLMDKKEVTAAQKGIATHLFMQFCDFERLKNSTAQEELQLLLEKGFISKNDADLVRLDEIELFKKSDIFADLIESKEVLRERRFNTLVPACDLTLDTALREKLKKDGINVTVQGVVDCIFTDGEGNAVLVDYKTDRLTKEELADFSLAEKKLLSRHSRQLSLYRDICADMIGKKFSRVLIYSLHLGKTVEVK